MIRTILICNIFLALACIWNSVFPLSAPFATSPTNSSLVVNFEPFQGLQDNDVLAYDISMRSLLNPYWSPIKSNFGIDGNNISDLQIVSIRVDQGAVLSSGTFQLELQFNNLLGEDFEKLARSAIIPWDATAAQMKAALSDIKGVAVREVRRCDEFGGSSQPGYGGSFGWGHGCPYLSRGGYRWLIVFDAPAVDRIPSMVPYRNHLGSGYSGPGLQISVTHIRAGMINPAHCNPTVCQYNITGLNENTPYTFKVRALTSDSGWTEFSSASAFVSTLARKTPSRPRPPFASSITSSLATLAIYHPALSDQVTSVDCQYRQVSIIGGSAPWLSLPEYILPPGPTVAPISITITSLQPNMTYEARVRYGNDMGHGLFSGASASFQTLSIDADLSLPPAPEIAIANDDSGLPAITATSIDVVVTANTTLRASTDRISYSVQYKSDVDTNWQSLPEVISYPPPSSQVRRYEISTRITTVNKTTSCSGYFWLKFGVVGGLPSWSITSPIPFDASSDSLTAALNSVGKIAAAKPRIMVRRYNNAQNGISWIVEIEGGPDMGKLDLFKHTMISTHLQSIHNPNATQSGHTNSSSGIYDVRTVYGPCWIANPTNPVVVQRLDKESSSQDMRSTVLRINQLLPQRRYYIRVVSVDKYGFPLATSSVMFAETREDYQTALLMSSELESNGKNGLWSLLSRLKPNVREAVDRMSILQQSITLPGIYNSPARQSDPYYSAGAGTGGLSGQNGASGHCAVISFNPRKLDGYRSTHFYYTGDRQYFVVPPMSNIDGSITFITIKCWGGGGAGGKVSDLVDVSSEMLTHYSMGGGGAFAQVTVHVQPGDKLTVVVAGGGISSHSEDGGAGGFGGGGRGGNALPRGGGGGGGGGASIVTRGDEVLLVAAGGAGGGSTDYCCALGGAAGTAFGGYAGTSPGDATPWPIASLLRNTPVRRRYEYTASACPDNAQGQFCISIWDELPESLPATHQHIQYGETPNANYSIWATAGAGANATQGGAPGTTGSIELRTTGDAIILMFDEVGVYNQLRGLQLQALFGSNLHGGNGADGKEGGGGGGGGWFGGGGGGSGIDGAGGGGGSSYVNDSATFDGQLEVILAALVPQPVLTYIDDISASVMWTNDWQDTLWGKAVSFDVELAAGSHSADFAIVGSVSASNISNPQAREVFYTIQGLGTLQSYQIRVIPVYSRGRGAPSLPLGITTLHHAINYWEPIVSRRLSLVATGRGFSDPVLNIPHLDKGVEILTSRTNPLTALDFSDPTTAKIQSTPSGRRGQSLSTVYSQVYMFGGRTTGYTCSSIYKDSLDLGLVDSGLNINPCTHLQGEVSELWSLDIHTYEWTGIDTTNWGSKPPPAREQHTASVIGTNIYIFGGKTRIFPKQSNGMPLLQYRSDHVFNDIWKLAIQPIVPLTLSSHLNVITAIPQDRRLYLPINGTTSVNDHDIENAKLGQCVTSLIVKVVVTHNCINQLRLSLMGPGPQTGSANFHDHSASHEVSLINQPRTTQAACVDGTQTFTFDDLAEVNSNDCCRDSSGVGSYRPDGKLAEFMGASPSAIWTLVAEDMRNDVLVGSIISWEIDFQLTACQPSFTWTNLSLATGSMVMPPVYQARSIVYGTAIFVFNGRDINDNRFNGLYRFETTTRIWTQLNPVDFHIALDFSSSIGANFMITPIGLLRFGGYRRQYDKPTSYIQDVFVQDPITQRWKQLVVHSTPFPSPLRTSMITPRYLSSSVFIPSSAMLWRRSFDYRGLFDRPFPSTFTNYANALMDSIFVFGGFDAATGSLYDGSSGGLLNDGWMLRMANESVPREILATEDYRSLYCEWRPVNPSTRTCLLNNNSPCSLRDLVLLAWCEKFYQSI